MFYYQGMMSPLDKSISYGDLVLPFVFSIYGSQHYIDDNFNLIDQSSEFATLKKSIDSHNICKHIDVFTNQTIYYNITFEKT